MFITVSREFGAGGSSLAGIVARELHWRLIDDEFIVEVARRAGLPAEDIARREERGISFIERLARTLVVATPELFGPAPLEVPQIDEERLVGITGQVARDLCGEGHAVMVGRAAAAVLADRSGAFNVRVIADSQWRAESVAARQGITLEEALKRVREVDSSRADYHRQWYRRDWADPHFYHLTLNTGVLGIETAATLVVMAVRKAMEQGEGKEFPAGR